MRRSEREVKEFDDIIKIVGKCEILRLGLSDDGVPYIVPLNFGYDVNDNSLTIYFHCSKEGRKIDILRRNPFVCFQSDCSYELVKGEAACHWTAKYESIIGYGKVSFIENPVEKKSAMDSVMRKYGFQGELEYIDKVLTKTFLCKLEVETITGKRNQ